MGRLQANRRTRSAGVTLAELLAVVAIIGMAITLAIPLITGAVRSANARAAVNGFAVNLKAARMLAVAGNAAVVVTIQTEPDPDCFCTETYYEYPDRRGIMRRFDMPRGVTIASSTAPITFRPNGSVQGGAATVIKTQLAPGSVEVWTIETSRTGVSIVERTREP